MNDGSSLRVHPRLLDASGATARLLQREADRPWVWRGGSGSPALRPQPGRKPRSTPLTTRDLFSDRRRWDLGCPPPSGSPG